MVAGHSHSSSFADVGGRLAALGKGITDPYIRAPAYEWYLLFGWSDRGGPDRRLCPGALVNNHQALAPAPDEAGCEALTR